MSPKSLPLVGYHSYEHYVADLDRAVDFYTKSMGFKKIGKSTAESREREGMERVVLAGGRNIHLILSKPTKEWSVGALYLKQHPEGVGFLNFKVSDLDATYKFLEPRGTTFLYNPHEIQDDKGKLGQVAIATALDDVNYRFIDDSKYDGFGSQFEMDAPAGSYESPYGFQNIDHVTANVRTLQPLSSFYRDVMGFQHFWHIEFHTNDVNPNLPVGSGLKSDVYWHPESGIKFANNEPWLPFFRNSQIDIFCRDNRGSGVQHLAFDVPNILSTMSDLHGGNVKFLDAPDSYYQNTPDRLKGTGFEGEIREDMNDLSKFDILIDGSEKGYLLQIFAHELSRLHDDGNAGPLFYEIIQREGDEGFGGGNFRALFETIEIDQIAMNKVANQLPLELI